MTAGSVTLSSAILIPCAQEPMRVRFGRILIEDHEGMLKAFEFKWGKAQKVRFPQTFTTHYSGSETYVISPANVEEFMLTPE